MKTVFILGAGASAEAGVPMMPDFLDRAERLFRGAPHQATEDVFRAINELQSVYAKSFLDLDNIESLFGAIEMAQLIGKLADRSRESITQLRANLISLIVDTIERTTSFPLGDQQLIRPPVPYEAFGKMIADISSRPDPMRCSLLTFNYDLGLDFCLRFAGQSFSYCLNDEPSGEQIPLLKLHGSISWGVCEECSSIIPVPPVKFPTRSATVGQPHTTIRVRAAVTQMEHCGKPLTGPLLIPPTWNKNEYHGAVARVWSQAAKELSEADLIFVIGYSLPPSDSFFRYLYALGSSGSTRLKRFAVINPDGSEAFKGRISDLLGMGIRNRLHLLSGGSGYFSQSLGYIQATIDAALRRD